MAIAAMSGPRAKPTQSRPVNREKSLELIYVARQIGLIRYGIRLRQVP